MEKVVVYLTGLFLVLISVGVYFSYSSLGELDLEPGTILSSEELSSYDVPVACTKMACLCSGDGDVDCNKCNMLDENRCFLTEVVHCQDGEQVGTSYRVEGCESQ